MPRNERKHILRISPLQRLPQKFDIWQIGVRQLETSVQSGKRTVQPWMVAAISHSEGQVMAFDILDDKPGAEEIWNIVERGMTEPAMGEPHRPTEVQVEEEMAWSADLEEKLDEVGVHCTEVQALDAFAFMLQELSDRLFPDQPGLLDMPDVEPAAVGSLFEAAAEYFRRAPWKKNGERPIKVACDKFENGPWYAVTIGQNGMTSGLIVYDDLGTLLEVQEGLQSEEENAQRTAALAVVFGSDRDLADADREAIEEHGWPVADPDAFPCVYRMDPGLAMRPPLAWELELLEGCLRAVPEFVRQKTRRLKPMQLTVTTAAGPLPLELSWGDD